MHTTELLTRIPLFRELDPEDLEMLAAAAISGLGYRVDGASGPRA